MTGANAWFTMEDGAEVDESKLKADVEANRLTFKSLKAVEKPRPQAAWLINSGFG